MCNPKTFTDPTTAIRTLWAEMLTILQASYDADPHGQVGALRDYTGEGTHDKLKALIDRERAHERRHRRMFPGTESAIREIDAARLILMRNIATGIERGNLNIKPDLLLTVRDTAAEALILGWALTFGPYEVPAGWLASVQALDYATAVKAVR